MRIPRFLLLVFVFLLQRAEAVNLNGKVTGGNGEAVPFAAVYVKGTTKGTTSNAEGFYSIDLAAGNYTIVYQAMGYMQKAVDIALASDRTVNVELASSSIQMKEAVVTDGEDPAYAVIRKAQAKRKYFLEQVESYSCDVYIKGLQRVTEHPEKIMGLEVDPEGEIDSVSGIVYLSESVSRFNYRRPNKVKEEMISSKVSGDNKAFSYNRASDMMFDFYENVISIEDLSERGFVSPIANTAMMFYKYRLVGTIFENDSLINKIEVIPRRKTDPCFRGYIYIMENSWRIYSTELYLTKDAQIDFVDTLLINQTFVPVEKNVWMVFMNKFTFNFGFMGLKGNGIFVGVNSNYVIDPDFPKRFFDNEEMHVNDDANKKDSVYWASTRPVPLTPEEENDYRRRDSIMRVRSSRAYLDSVDRMTNRPGFMDIVFAGYSFSRRYRHFSVSVSPLVRACSFNTVQGLRAGIDATLFKTWDDNRWFSLGPAASYGFSDKRFYADLEASYSYRPVHFERITIAGGTTTAQFNAKEPVPVFINTLYTLLQKQNYLKLYAKSYFYLNWHREIVNGLMMTFAGEYSDRKPLYNTARYYWIEYPERHFTSNNPLDALDENYAGFDPHRALDLNLQLTFRFRQKYYTRPNEKIILGSKYPVLGLQVRKGVPGFFGSKTDYDFLKLSVRDNIDLKLLGKFSYYVGAGKYISKKNLPFMDYYHFVGNRTLWSTFPQQSYQLLDYYRYSAGDWYVEAHAEHHFGGFILNKIPLLRRLHLTEVAGVNWLMTPDVPSYYEIYFGADKLGLIRVDFALGYMQQAKVSAGLRFGIRFD